MYTITEKIMKADMNPSVKLVWTFIQYHIKNTPKDNLSFQTIADGTSLNTTSVQSCVKVLLEQNLIYSYKDDRNWRYYFNGENE